MSGSTECVQVMVRCRPLNSKERGDNRAPIVAMDCERGQIILKNQRVAAAEEVKQFTFDAVFDVASTQEQVFATVAQPIIDSTMSGYNGTIFAYGQTGTGKVCVDSGSVQADTALAGRSKTLPGQHVTCCRRTRWKVNWHQN